LTVQLTGCRKIFLWLGLYFLLHLLVRLLVSPGLELDEAEQLVLTQGMQLGYGSQPPLYTWLLGGLFQLFGVGIFSLALLKNLLLSATYLLTYRSARELGYGRDVSLAVMLSLFFIPQIVWESQRDLTHSVLATTLAAATICCWLRLGNRVSAGGYAVLGLISGLGLLAKYNYGIFLLSLFAASASIREYRQLLLRRQMLGSLAISSLLVAPHALWMAGNTGTVMKQSHKFNPAAVTSRGEAMLTGFTDLFMAILMFALPLAVLYLVLFLWQRRQGVEAPGLNGAPGGMLLVRCIVASVLICMVMVLLFRVTVFKDRWMQPFLFFLPLALLPWMAGILQQGGARFIRWAALTVGVLVLLLMAGRPALARFTGSTGRFNLPYQDLAAALEGEVSRVDLVVAQNRLMGGNLRLRYPQTRVAVPELQLSHPVAVRTVLAVWEEGRGKGGRSDTDAVVADLLGPDSVQLAAGEVSAPLRYLPDRTMTLSYAVHQRANQ
jgi:4-amino-4-deoxy-L-arabinose transferase-like glycosyltransferase